MVDFHCVRAVSSTPFRTPGSRNSIRKTITIYALDARLRGRHRPLPPIRHRQRNRHPQHPVHLPLLRLPGARLAEHELAERVDELVDLFGLGAFRSKRIGDLSTGSRRMVDLACVVAHRPRVVLLDEPTSGIAQREAEALGPVLLGLRDRLGASLLVIEHDISLISSVSDRLVALDQGAVVTGGPPGEVLEHPAVVASYLGTGGDTLARSGERGGAAR